MSEATMDEADMNGSNPYSAPGADLGGNQAATYEPKVFSFHGRLGRIRYFGYNMVMSFLTNLAMIPVMGTAMLGGSADPESMGAVSIIVLLAVIAISVVFSVMFAKRRLNDLDRSGWWMLLFIVPIANLLLAIYMVFFPGSESANRYGPVPSPNPLGLKILFWLMITLFVLGIVSAVALPMLVGGPS